MPDCIERVTGLDQMENHHEWRILTSDTFRSNQSFKVVFYCVFCRCLREDAFNESVKE